MLSSTRQTIYYSLLVAILVAILVICADLLVYAAFGDNTALGDPYYQDTLLANQRAPLALIASWLVVSLSVMAGIIKPKSQRTGASEQL